jgi:hypothetical protein
MSWQFYWDLGISYSHVQITAATQVFYSEGYLIVTATARNGFVRAVLRTIISYKSLS